MLFVSDFVCEPDYCIIVSPLDKPRCFGGKQLGICLNKRKIYSKGICLSQILFSSFVRSPNLLSSLLILNISYLITVLIAFFCPMSLTKKQHSHRDERNAIGIIRTLNQITEIIEIWFNHFNAPETARFLCLFGSHIQPEKLISIFHFPFSLK